MTLLECLRRIATETEGHSAEVARAILREVDSKPMTPERAKLWAREVVPDVPHPDDNQ